MNLAVQSINLQPEVLPTSKPAISYHQVLPMKIRDLPITECCVDDHLTVREVAKILDQYPDWPGVILTKQNHFVGMLSRQRCFEVLGKPFGIEIYSKKTILDFFKAYGTIDLPLDINTTIQEAVKSALNRDQSMIYEPIVVILPRQSYGLLNMHTLLLTQNNLLEHLYSEVQHLSVIDPLTNLSNRRGFFEAAQPEIDASRANHNDLAALMIDIDNFKNTNDAYGHFVGDQVIRSVAEEIQKCLRQTDLLGRFGGEEFIALLPNTSVETACLIAERLRNKVENRVVFVNGFQVSVTISIGVCHINEARGLLDTLLSQADQAMYWAKACGRNQVMKWDYHLAYRMRTERSELEPRESLVGSWTSRLRVDAARIYDETIEGWAKALELRDKETQGHAQRVVNLTLELARRTGISEEGLVDIRRGALLHDMGKIAVPDTILFKPGPLNENEWEKMREHPVFAFEFLNSVTFLQKCIDIPYCHHEHWDGSGYPRGLKGEEIPLAARIFTIVDVWDALTTDRCYRPAWQLDEVQKYMLEQSGKLFDPNLTRIFFEMLDVLYEAEENDELNSSFVSSNLNSTQE